MATVKQVLEQVDAMLPNQYTTAEKRRWLLQAEGFVVREVHQPHAGGEETEVPPEDTGEDSGEARGGQRGAAQGSRRMVYPSATQISADRTATLPSHRSPAHRDTHAQHRAHICATTEVRVGGCA